MKKVAIAGVGLIGASFGLGLRKAGFDGEIAGVSSPAAIEAGLRAGAISRGIMLSEAASWADLIYLAQPVDRILETITELGSLARPALLVTDAGSTKSAIVERARQALPPGTFLGGHPMAGKESRGASHADPDLFRGRTYVLTPDSPGEAAPDFDTFKDWLRAIGANLLEMPPPAHDSAVAFTSHLPQLLSTALAATLATEPNEFIPRVFGTGLLDMTRLALSSPDLWRSILASNQTEITRALSEFERSLASLKASLASGDIENFFSAGAAFASSIR